MGRESRLSIVNTDSDIVGAKYHSAVDNNWVIASMRDNYMDFDRCGEKLTPNTGAHPVVPEGGSKSHGEIDFRYAYLITPWG